MIVVFGSVNLDLVVRVARLPRPGETLACTINGAQAALPTAAAIARLAAAVESRLLSHPLA